MFLKQAKAERFRNYKQFSLEFSRPISVFTGDNGQGKSSILEAMYCALRGRSFHPFISTQFIQNSHSSAKICLSFEELEGKSELSASFYSEEFGRKKEILYCGKRAGPSFLSKKFPVFVFTEASMKCIRQGPEQRRVFVDEMIHSDNQDPVRGNFHKILKQKRTLLKNIKQGLLFQREANNTLSAINQKFLEVSFLLVQERLRFLEKLFSSLKGLEGDFFKPPFPKLGFSYIFQKNQTFGQGDDIFFLLKQDLEEKHDWEIGTGIPLSGPQKHEIQFLFNGEDSRTFCSKGEQRSLILCLMAGHIQSQPKAFLFLDDVLMELDENTQNRFLQFLEKSHCQTFLTSCKVIPFKTKNMSFFSIKNGIIKNQHD